MGEGRKKDGGDESSGSSRKLGGGRGATYEGVAQHTEDALLQLLGEFFLVDLFVSVSVSVCMCVVILFFFVDTVVCTRACSCVCVCVDTLLQLSSNFFYKMICTRARICVCMYLYNVAYACM